MAEGLRITANARTDNKPTVTFEGAARAYISSDRIPRRFTTNQAIGITWSGMPSRSSVLFRLQI